MTTNPTEGERKSLRSDALGFAEILMQGVTHIAPAVGLILTLQVLTTNAGSAAPLAFLIGFLVILALGISLTQLARCLPSAGGYYHYVSRTVHPNAGFLTGWIYFLYDPPLAAINLAFMGYFVERTLRSEYHMTFPWWVFLILSTAFITVMVYRGVSVSTHVMMLVGVGEIVIVAALAVFCILHPGPGGVSLQPFSPRSAPSVHGLYLAVVFSIFNFTGFESVAPLAEESHDPKRNLPRAIIGSILCMGVFFIAGSWALVVGWGTNDLASLNGSGENPAFVLARRLWGQGWILIFLAVLNSVIAVSISCTNSATRVLFAMGRAGVLPASLTRIHPRFRTPTNAILLQTLITLAVGLGLGFLLGPDQEFYFMGVVMTLSLVLVYGAGNLGVFRLYKYERPVEFRFGLHVLCPLLSTIAMGWVGFRSVFPLPYGPIHYAPALVIAWIAIGCAVLWWVRSTHGKALILPDNCEALPATECAEGNG